MENVGKRGRKRSRVTARMGNSGVNGCTPGWGHTGERVGVWLIT